MRQLKRKPDFSVKIIRPNFETTTFQGKDIVEFIPYKKGNDKKQSDNLLSYNFSESIGTSFTTFSFVTTVEKDSDGNTWYDKISKMDLVFIYEFAKLRFIGYVKDRNYSASMGSDGRVSRSIVFSGGSMGEMLSCFKLLLNQFLYMGKTTAQNQSLKLSIELEKKMDKGAQLAPIFKSVYEAFFQLVLDMGENPSGKGIKTILDKYIDHSAGLSTKATLLYPVIVSLYQVGENNIWEIWNNLAQPPVHELFGMMDEESEKFKLVFRPTPFEPEDWSSLTINEIPPIILSGYSLSDTLNEVFSYYLGILPGSSISAEFAMATSMDTSQDMKGSAPYVIDSDKWSKYGYKPLIVEFRYFDRSQVEQFNGAIKAMRDCATKLKNWYQHNDEFISGNISIMTIDERMWGINGLPDLKVPRVGERIKFLDGEFYIESDDHSWSYGGPMISNLRVSRGYKYDRSGNFIAPMEEVGQRLKLF